MSNREVGGDKHRKDSRTKGKRCCGIGSIICGIRSLIIGSGSVWREFRRFWLEALRHTSLHINQGITMQSLTSRTAGSPTGRIDFSDSQSTGIFILRAEDCRIVDSSVGHREVRWRTATLDEAKDVVVAYHAQRNLAMAADYVVSTPTKHATKFGHRRRASEGSASERRGFIKTRLLMEILCSQ